MDNLIVLCVITALVIVASYVLSISWHDFTRHLVQVKKRVVKSKKSA
jgi:cell division protein FtsL